MENLKIEPKEVHFGIVAKQPTAEEVASLSKIIFSEEKLKRKNKKLVKEKIKTLWGAIGTAVALLLAAGFVFLMLDSGRIESGSAMRGIMWLFVIGAPIGAVVSIVLGIAQLFSSSKIKTPEKVYTIWDNSVFGEEFFIKQKFITRKNGRMN